MLRGKAKAVLIRCHLSKPRDYACQNVEGDKARQNHSKTSSAEVGRHLDVGEVSSSTAGGKLVGQGGRRVGNAVRSFGAL